MSVRLSEHFTLADLATGEIATSREQPDGQEHELSLSAVTLAWRGSPLVRIARSLWRQLPVEMGQRGSNNARLGPWRLTLMEDDPLAPYEVWYREPGKLPVADWAVANG